MVKGKKGPKAKAVHGDEILKALERGDQPAIDATLAEIDAERDAKQMAEVLDRIAMLCRKNKKLMIHTFGALLYEPDPDGWVRETSELSHGRGFGIRHRAVYPVFERHRKRGLRAMSVNPRTRSHSARSQVMRSMRPSPL